MTPLVAPLLINVPSHHVGVWEIRERGTGRLIAWSRRTLAQMEEIARHHDTRQGDRFRSYQGKREAQLEYKRAWRRARLAALAAA